MAERLLPSLRDLLEGDLRALAAAGHLPARGERELRIRIGDDGRIRWLEPTRIRVPASELDPDSQPLDTSTG